MKQLKATVIRRRRYFKQIKLQIRGWYQIMDLWRCSECDMEKDIELHHVLPLEYCGTNNIWNIVPICRNCHKDLHRQWDIEYREW